MFTLGASSKAMHAGKIGKIFTHILAVPSLRLSWTRGLLICTAGWCSLVITFWAVQRRALIVPEHSTVDPEGQPEG
jgi:hypothetical protein